MTAVEVGRRHRPAPNAIAAVLLATAATLLGGASSNARVPLIAIELLSIPVGVSAARRLMAKGGWRQARWPLVLISAMLAIPLVQSMPLPPDVWLNAPGQAPRFTAMILEGLTLTWAPLSLDPSATLAAIPALFPPIAMFLATVALSNGDRRHVVLAWIIAATAGLMLGLAQIAQPTGGWAYPYGETNRGSLVGWFANRNHEAALLLALAPLAAAFASAGGGLRWWVAPFVLLVLAGVAAGGSRAGIALSLPVLLLSFVAVLRRPGRLDRSWRMVAIMVAALVAVVAIGVLASTPILARFGHEAGPEFRYQVWPLIWGEASHHLPFGSGVGSFDRVFRAIEPLSLLAPAYLNHAHNDYLEVWLEAGVPGAVLIGALVAWIVVAARSAWFRAGSALARAASVSLLALAIMSWVDYPLRTEVLATLAAFCCALLIPRPSSSEQRSD